MKRKLIHPHMIQINLMNKQKQNKIVVVCRKIRYMLMNGIMQLINKLLQIQLKFKSKLLQTVKNKLRKKDIFQNYNNKQKNKVEVI